MVPALMASGLAVAQSGEWASGMLAVVGGAN
jgi:hypothetical protein